MRDFTRDNSFDIFDFNLSNFGGLNCFPEISINVWHPWRKRGDGGGGSNWQRQNKTKQNKLLVWSMQRLLRNPGTAAGTSTEYETFGGSRGRDPKKKSRAIQSSAARVPFTETSPAVNDACGGLPGIRPVMFQDLSGTVWNPCHVRAPGAVAINNWRTGPRGFEMWTTVVL